MIILLQPSRRPRAPSARRLVRTRVEPGSFEVLSRLLEQRGCGCRRRRRGPQQPVDVVDAEADAFHVERSNRARQRLAFVGNRCRGRIGTQQRRQFAHARLSAFTMIDTHGPTA